MNTLLPILANVIAIGALTLGLYFPRHHRRDLLTAYLGVNVGVLAVSAVLMDSAIGAGLGLGLFGVLSIIRLRSDELSQTEVAYYFSSLALGLLGGLSTAPIAITASLMVAIVAVMAVADSPALFAGYRREVMVIDGVFPTEAALVASLEAKLGGRIYGVSVTKADYVNETTTAEVRWRITAGASSVAPVGAPEMETVR